jgi:glycosyltransferase involved in cell wall biosynthesis
MKTTLFIPVLNEIEGLKVIMPKIKREWVDEIIIVDGHSTDGTREYLTEHGFPFLDQKQRGLFSAWWQGFEAATGDVIIPFSPDGNSVPEVIPELVAKMREGYDMVMASRYLGPAKSEDDGVATSIGNFLFTRTINVLFGGHYTDALGMYRAFRKEILYSLKLDRHKADVFEVLLSIRAAKYKLKIGEIPGDEPPRIGDQTSRAWPGLIGRARGASLMIKLFVREFFTRKE